MMCVSRQRQKRKRKRRAAFFLTVWRSVASFSMEGFRLSTALRPSWKKLNRKRVNLTHYRGAAAKLDCTHAGASCRFMTSDTGMGIDKILLTQMPLSILFIDPILDR